jgi:hypothetical protein
MLAKLSPRPLQEIFGVTFGLLGLFSMTIMTSTFVSSDPIFNPAASALVGGSNASGSGTSTARIDGGLDFTGSGNHFSDPGADMLAFSYSGTANGTVVPGIYIYYNFTDLVQMSDLLTPCRSPLTAARN